MVIRVSLLAICLTGIYLVIAGSSSVKAAPPTSAVGEQYPIMDRLADRVIQKYQQSSCEQLLQKREEPKAPNPKEQEIVQKLRNDPQMRTAFIDKVAAPIANKLFECRMIP